MSTEGFGGLDDIDFGSTLRAHRVGDRLFGRFALEKELGRGGMGVVWKAKDELLSREVVLKFLPEVVRYDTMAVEELKEETRKGLELAHPNIVKVYDFNLDDRNAAISMEFVDGDTMAKLRTLQPSKVFEPEEIRNWVAQLVGGLHYAHTTARIVHRDLKPSNLIIGKNGALKIMDFGIARSIADSIIRVSMREPSTGTLPYMSPQQAMGKPASISDDIYSFGCTLYELLTGKPPFFTGNVMEQVRSVKPTSVAERRLEFGVSGQPVPEQWEAVLQSCLAKEPAARPRDMLEIGRRLGLLGDDALANLIGTDTSKRRDLEKAAQNDAAAAVEAPAAEETEPQEVHAEAGAEAEAVAEVEAPTPAVAETPTSGLGQNLTQAHTGLGPTGQTGQTGATLTPRTASIAAPLQSKPLSQVSGTGKKAAPASTAATTTARKAKPAGATAKPRPAKATAAGSGKKSGSPFLGIAIALFVLLLLFGGGIGGAYVAYKKFIEPKFAGKDGPGKEDPVDPDQLRFAIEAQLAANNQEEVKRLLQEYLDKVGRDAFSEALGQKMGLLAAVDTPPVDKPPIDTPPVDQPPVDQPPVDNPPTDTKNTASTDTQTPVEPGEPQPLLVPDKFATIQAAIDAAKPGEVISIKPNYYEEMLTLKSGVTLEPQAEQPVVIRAAGKNGSVLTADGVKDAVVRGLIFEHSGDTDDESVRWAVVALKNSAVTLDNCQIRRGMGAGLSISGAGANLVRKCTIERNAWYGVTLERGANATLESCTSQQNGGPGIFIAHIGTRPILRGNTIMRNLHSGVVIEEEGQALLEGNVSELNLETGAFLNGSGVSAEMKGNKFNSNKIEGVMIQDGAKVVMVENEIKSNQRNGLVIFDGADGSQITNNQIVGNALAGLVMAISPNGTGKYAEIVVKGNTVSGHSQSGILMDGRGVNPQVLGNKVHSNGQHDIRPLNGAQPVLKDNLEGAAANGVTPGTPPAGVGTQTSPQQQLQPTGPATPPTPGGQPILNAKNTGDVPVLNPEGGDDEDSAMRRHESDPPPAPNNAPPAPTPPAPPSQWAPTPTPPAADQAPAQPPTPSGNPQLPSKNTGNVPVLDPDAGM